MIQFLFRGWHRVAGVVGLWCVLNGFALGGEAPPGAVALPAGVSAVWDLGQAVHETTPTRERVCLNGLWEWQPAEPEAATAPKEGWGWFKVPGAWPGKTDYMQKDCQTVFAHPAWRERNLATVTAAWYRREFTVPAGWNGRRVTLSSELLNSYALVLVDGRRAGELHFPGGELELLDLGAPGGSHTLEILVVALPIKGVLQSYLDSAAGRQVKGTVNRRGLCGDVFLAGTPAGPRLGDVRPETSVRRGDCAFEVGVTGLPAGRSYRVRAMVAAPGGAVTNWLSDSFQAGDLKEGRFTFRHRWRPERLWDTHTPLNQCAAELSLLDEAGAVVDTAWPVKFGFREFWIAGRDFYLNGTRLFFSAVPLDNAQVGAAWATYAAARESFRRLQSFGINFVYTHNYDCDPGAHLAFDEILRAADDTGMLVAVSQPHFSHFDWPNADADRTNGYARHAAAYVRTAQAHPAVILYAMSHNATGYDEDMNPDLIDGRQDLRDNWAARNSRLALRAEAIVAAMDPSRPVYHHASGNLGTMHVINFYPNFVPVQELSDWFGHWAEQGVKPAFLCEYGAPFTWDWTMYRGWYQGRREFGSAAVPWEFCLAEWNAQFLGDRAFPASGAEQVNLRWEAKQFAAGRGWHRWNYPNEVGSHRFTERYPVFAEYVTDNWRAFRTWGVSGISPWEYEHFWTLRPGVDRGRKELAVDWAHLQRPGFSPDYLDSRFERMDLAFEPGDWVATPAAEALVRNNRPLLAWLAGKPAAFTSKDHNFLPGGVVEKQLIVINSSRESVLAECAWTLALPAPVTGGRKLTVAPGDQVRLPLRFELPVNLPAADYALCATVVFGSGETQSDEFMLHVAARPPAVVPAATRVALFDPVGQTAAGLAAAGIGFQKVEAETDLAGYDLLIVGKAALSVTGAAPAINRVAGGLKVLVFEQTAAGLERRLGFRVAEYGLRRVFARVPGHPAIAGIAPEAWADWRGAATLSPPQLAYTNVPRYGPVVEWAGLEVPHLWRCGNRGNVASVLIEKPAVGDFLPLVDGGFSLQYSPLLEYREGGGMVLFCQLDVTGRTEREPVADALVRQLVAYAAQWRPSPRRTVSYAGGEEGRRYLTSLGLTPAAYQGGRPAPGELLVLGTGGEKEALRLPATGWAGGGPVLALGWGDADAQTWGPVRVEFRTAEHLSTSFAAEGAGSVFAGIGPADAHLRAPLAGPLVRGGAVRAIGDGVLAQATNAPFVFCQLEPWRFSVAQANTKRTFRRTAFLLSRLLGNLGVGASTPLLERFGRPPADAVQEARWRTGFYLDTPAEWDDPYRHFRW